MFNWLIGPTYRYFEAISGFVFFGCTYIYMLQAWDFSTWIFANRQWNQWTVVVWGEMRRCPLRAASGVPAAELAEVVWEPRTFYGIRLERLMSFLWFFFFVFADSMPEKQMHKFPLQKIMTLRWSWSNLTEIIGIFRALGTWGILLNILSDASEWSKASVT
jgi:hypothetical protein